MADIAIDPTDIRTPSTSGPAAKPRFGRKTLLVASGVTLGVAALGGTAAAIVSSINLPSNLSGLAFLPKPEAPRRSEIRIGRLPDMPEIRDGVPAVVGTQPVRVVGPASMPTGEGPRTVNATTVSAAALPAAPLPTTFTGPGAPQHLISAVSAPLSPARLDRPASPAGDPAPALVRAAAGPVAAPALVAPEPKPSASVVMAKAEPARNLEPASTASVSAVPLPPPAPVRNLVRAPESRVEKPAVRPAQLASRQPAQPVTPPTEAVTAPAPPPDDRVEILGVKLPNGSDLKNAVSSIGEALNLPKPF